MTPEERSAIVPALARILDLGRDRATTWAEVIAEAKPIDGGGPYTAEDVRQAARQMALALRSTDFPRVGELRRHLEALRPAPSRYKPAEPWPQPPPETEEQKKRGEAWRRVVRITLGIEEIPGLSREEAVAQAQAEAEALKEAAAQAKAEDPEPEPEPEQEPARPRLRVV